MGFNSIFKQQFTEQRPDCAWPGPPSAEIPWDSQPGLNKLCQSGTDWSSDPCKGKEQWAGSLCCGGAVGQMLRDLCHWARFTCCRPCSSKKCQFCRNNCIPPVHTWPLKNVSSSLLFTTGYFQHEEITYCLSSPQPTCFHCLQSALPVTILKVIQGFTGF